jgi:hypothetical protein
MEHAMTTTQRTAERTSDAEFNIAADTQTLYRDGIVGLKSAFERDWVEQLREDMMTAFWSAIQRPGGAISRGPRRWYVEVHPQDIKGFADLVTHPWITGLSEAVVGPDYQIVEVGFDVPFQGAKNQPWHRDFASPPDTYRDHKITSLAFNLTGVDVTEDMGPFEIAPGTQFDDGRSWNHEMFPPKEEWRRFAERAVRKYPRMGDISARSALTLHRGTQHASPIARPVLILGVDEPKTGDEVLHELEVTRDFLDALPRTVTRRLRCHVVDELKPIVQKHDIEGLVMGVE